MVAQGAAAADPTGASDGDGYTAIGAGIALGPVSYTHLRAHET